MPFIRAALLATLALLVGAIIWAAMRASLGASFAAIIADPWGVVTLIDLYAGFLAAAVMVFCVEPKRAVAWAVALTMPVLGNPVLIGWLLWRGLALLQRKTNV